MATATATAPAIHRRHHHQQVPALNTLSYSDPQIGQKKGRPRRRFAPATTCRADATTSSDSGKGCSCVSPRRRDLAALLTGSVLEKAKREIDKILQVSWADLIAVAGAEAVSLCKGPFIPVRTGRVDSRMPDPEGKLPEESLDASGLKSCFLKKGFSTQELVALSGAHTIGGKGFGSPVVFDNAYYKILLQKPWTLGEMSSMIGLPSDHALVEDDECLRWIRTYADDEVQFFDDFKSAYRKLLVDSGAAWRAT